jgi:hypothetical protein
MAGRVVSDFNAEASTVMTVGTVTGILKQQDFHDLFNNKHMPYATHTIGVQSDRGAEKRIALDDYHFANTWPRDVLHHRVGKEFGATKEMLWVKFYAPILVRGNTAQLDLYNGEENRGVLALAEVDSLMFDKGAPLSWRCERLEKMIDRLDSFHKNADFCHKKLAAARYRHLGSILSPSY